MVGFHDIDAVACLALPDLLDVPSGGGVDLGGNFWNQSHIFTRLYYCIDRIALTTTPTSESKSTPVKK